MTPSDADVEALAQVIERHLILPITDVRGNKMSRNFAQNIFTMRDMGAAAFHQSESRRQILSLDKPLESLKTALEVLSKIDRFALEIYGYHGDVAANRDPDNSSHLKEFERLIVHYLQGIRYARSNDGLSKPRKIAHLGTDWRKVATVRACREVWAWDQLHSNTPKWQKHTKGAPKDPSGRQDIDPAHLMGFVDSFAPTAAQRDLPGKFGSFLEAVLEFFPERDMNGNSFNAQDSLRAYTSVRKRLRK